MPVQPKHPKIVEDLVPQPSFVPNHALLRAGVHFKDEHDRVQNQAAIVAVFPSGNTTIDDLALLQCFSWIIGEPSTQRLIPLVEIASRRSLGCPSARICLEKT